MLSYLRFFRALLLAAIAIYMCDGFRIKAEKKYKARDANVVDMDAPNVPSLLEENLTVASENKVDCSKLQGVEIAGKDLGGSLVLVCQMWPESWGAFPAQTLEQATQLANMAFGEGGVYDQVKELAAERVESGGFCWRRNEERMQKEPDSYTCPFDSISTEPKVVDGRHICERTCDVACDGQFHVEKAGDLCTCLPSAFDEDLYRTVERDADADMEGCVQVRNGRCYDDCPSGFHPTFIMGSFLPVCTLSCSSTTKPFECGFGCASSEENCTQTMATQVGEVVRSVGRTAGFMTGRIDVILTTDALASVVTFSIAVVGKMVKSILNAIFMNKTKVAELLASLLKLVSGEEFMSDLSVLAGKYGEFVNLMKDIIAAFTAWRFSTVKELAKTFMNHGALAIAQVYNVLKAFLWPRCEVV